MKLRALGRLRSPAMVFLLFDRHVYRLLRHTTHEVITMDSNMMEPAVSFGTMLQSDNETARFYDHCTMEQKQAIFHQLREIQTPEQLKAFVKHLPSAAL